MARRKFLLCIVIQFSISWSVYARSFPNLVDSEEDSARDLTSYFEYLKYSAKNGSIIYADTNGSRVINMNTDLINKNISKINFWWLPGEYFKSSDGSLVPIGSWGYDPVFGTINNAFWISRSKNIPGKNDYLWRIDDAYGNAGGVEGDVVGALKPTCRVSAIMQHDYVWCANFNLISSALNAQNVADDANAVRPFDALADGKGPRGEIWGRFTHVTDQTGQGANLSGSMVGHEIDMDGNGIGESGLFGRIIWQTEIAANAASPVPFGVGAAYEVGSNDQNSYYNKGFHWKGRYTFSVVDFTDTLPWFATATIAIAVPIGSSSITLNTVQNGIYAGQYITLKGIPSGTQVTRVDYMSSTITLNHATTTNIAAGSQATFDGHFVPITLGEGHPISFAPEHNLFYRKGILDYQVDNKSALSVDDRGTINPQGGLQLPALTVAQIKSLKPRQWLMVADKENKALAIWVDGQWHHVSLGASF